MKTIGTLLSLLLCVSFCNGTPLLSKHLWKTTASYADPRDDKKLSLIDQELNKISAYENVKEKVCPDNQASWEFFRHLETGKIIVQNDFQILPLNWNEAVEEANRFPERHKMSSSTSLVRQFDDHHVEMKPFVRCLSHCFDLSEMFETAVWRGKIFLIESLVEVGFPVNDDVTNILIVKLPYAIHCDDTDKLRTLIGLGALSAKYENGVTALHKVAIEAEPEYAPIARVLIEKGADKDSKDNLGRTALHYWAMKGKRTDFAKVLIDNGANANVKDEYGKTALHYAAEWNNEKNVKFLIESGTNKDEKDNNNETALHLAAMSENEGEFSWKKARVARVLIEKGAEKDAKNNKGQTALHIAAIKNSAEVAKILIKSGADKNAKDNNNETALQVAIGENNEEVENILKAEKHELVDDKLEECLRDCDNDFIASQVWCLGQMLKEMEKINDRHFKNDANKVAEQSHRNKVAEQSPPKKFDQQSQPKKSSRRFMCCPLLSCFKKSNSEQKSKK